MERGKSCLLYTSSIGKAYGYQLGVKHKYKEGMFDQVDRVLFDLKNNPYSRRIMTNIYVHEMCIRDSSESVSLPKDT